MIELLSKQVLLSHTDEFLKVIEGVEHEYWSRDHFLADLPGKWEYSLYYSMDNIIIGFVITSQKNNSLHIHKFMVSEAYRNLGIGEQLLLNLESLAKSRFTSLTLKVYEDNLSAIRFYEKHGFRRTILKENLYYMEKCF